jgi:hypothetical protein
MQPPISQSQKPLPLANAQRPLTSSRPSEPTARPRGENTPPTATPGVP